MHRERVGDGPTPDTRHQTPGHHKAQPTASGDDIVIN